MGESKRDVVLQLVTFEQAKRLNEAGFDWGVSFTYDNDGTLEGRNTPFGAANFNNGDGDYSAPAVALALKWCRDVKGIDAFVKTDPNGREPPVNLSYLAILGGRLVSNYCRYYDEAESALLDAVLDFLGNGSFDA